MNRRLIEFGMRIEPPRRLARPLSEAKMEAIRKATAASLGKAPRGERNGFAKLTEAQVRKIRALRAAGERPSVLARRFELDRVTVWHVLTRRTWSHV